MIDEKAPDFEADAYIDGRFGKVRLSDYKGKWVILVFYPKDFSEVCPTELVAFAEEYEEFTNQNISIIAASNDSVNVHKDWLRSTPELRMVKYPVLADEDGKIATKYEVFDRAKSKARRGLFVIDPEGIIRYIAITDDTVGRSTIETYRVVAALQTGKLCGANWTPGKPTLDD